MVVKKLPLTPWGREQAEYHTRGDGEFAGESGSPEDPRYHKACGAPSSPAELGAPLEIVQSSHRLLIIHESDLNTSPIFLRQIWIGREHPKDPTDYTPTWMGHSVAKWDRDTLVVDTIAIREGTVLDLNLGAPHSDQLHMVERYQLVDRETLRIDRTFTDPKAYTEPWSSSKVFTLLADWEKNADEWELAEQHQVCVGGQWPTTDDYFQNYDSIKGFRR